MKCGVSGQQRHSVAIGEDLEISAVVLMGYKDGRRLLIPLRASEIGIKEEEVVVVVVSGRNQR